MASERADSADKPGTAALDEYATKRSFGATPEPAPAPIEPRAGPLLFVVQQHAARQLHFDFRLELDGVLKSWAVPKGLLIQPGEKHLAVPTEDHPLTYGPFEGTIPKGQYGAGSVIVWDCGLYSPDTNAEYAFADRAQAEERVRAELAAGKLSLFLLGAKLKGSFALVRTKDKTWLLLKHRDPWGVRPGGAGPLDQSVLSGHTVGSIATAGAIERTPLARLIAHGPREALPAKLTPMLAGTAAAPFADSEWSFEPKLDGYRVLAHVAADRVQLRSRNGLDLTAAFPAIAADLQKQVAQPMVLDGEVIALQDGRPSFGALQNRARLKAAVDIEAAERASPTVFFCFDLLHLLGLNLRQCPYDERRRYLRQSLLPTQRIQLVHAEADGNALYGAAIAAGFEGMMAKRRTGTYHAGARSADWLKVKAVQSAEFVVGGYTEGKNSRGKTFGALVLGAWNGEKLRPVGNVGSGFDDRALASIQTQLRERGTKTMPFDTTPEAESRMHWVRPELVAEIQFQGWTDAGLLRAPIFLRLRDDVDVRSVRHGLERAKAAEVDASSPEVDHVLQQLAGYAANLTLAVGAHRIKLTNLDKPLWPAHDGRAAVTKRDLLRYLATAAPCMLPHLVNRPITVVRMPDGIGGEMFFQKHWEGTSLPPFLSAVSFENAEGVSKPYLLCNNLASLLWLGQMGALEYHVIHASLPEASRPSAGRTQIVVERDVIDWPDYVTFDLDPYIYAGTEGKGEEPVYNPAAFAKAREVAFHLRDVLAAMSMCAFVKTTGKTGLHIFVPIERTITADQAREVCRLVGQHLLRKHPKDITMDWTIDKRTGRIFLDHNMNGRGRTLNAAYSPRRVPGACVSMPLTWDELARAEPTDFRVPTLAERLRQTGDAWRDFAASKHNLTRLLNLPG
jgi:bifunctional non-homologous end joining protein LigD